MQIYNSSPKPGDLIQLVTPSRKVYFITLHEGGNLHTHRGIISHDDLLNTHWGSEVLSHQGSSFYLLQPNLADLISEIPRSTQIMYPKDIGFVLVTMGIGPGSNVIEAGTGSGALTLSFAGAVGDQGKVASYEIRPDVQNLARKNLARFDLHERVTLKTGDIANGFDETNVDAIFLDVPDSYNYIEQVKQAIKPGGYFGSILPTTNQVMKLLSALFQNGFSVIDVCEILLRYYKPIPERLRPTDRMVAHTGFLIFGRSIIQLTQE